MGFDGFVVEDALIRPSFRDQLIATIDDVKTIDFVINNLDDGDHPFHLSVLIHCFCFFTDTRNILLDTDTK